MEHYTEICPPTEPENAADSLARRILVGLAEKERVLKIQQERATLDTVVFNLSKTFEEPPPCVFTDFSTMLDRNARILNAAFEYYLDKAEESPRADQKIRLAVYMQSQLIRTVDAWRRLENFHQSKTK